MKTETIFNSLSYKAIMSLHLLGPQKRGQLTRAAAMLQCQRSYLSRVIKEKLHLTSEHAFNLARFLKFNEDERIYFQTLVEFERSADPEYKSFLKNQLAQLKRKNESIEERTKRTHITAEKLQITYFSTWIWSAIHFLTCIPKYQNIDEICDRLGINKQTALNYLKSMASQDLVEKVGEKWIYKSGEFHLPKDSPLVVNHHQNWRAKAVMDSVTPNSDHIHFTGVLTISQKDYDRIKDLLLTFITEANLISGPSNPEDAVTLTCDLFKI